MAGRIKHNSLIVHTVPKNLSSIYRPRLNITFVRGLTRVETKGACLRTVPWWEVPVDRLGCVADA